ncbi:MAG: 5-formyltetrahydrofolate cyclo-ligase [Ezakiella sp.]|nr:5-formyltetrahydrofolate cyclo-ligase [Ezakiella sp.]MDD7761749.1 5-formyltetrahydrofolate cyclo-ligase [Bacillota bacterium]MDY3946564.1 5-formyltetrahydrofolate cyclo-ligase [Ezakiella sp.]
MDKKQIRKEVLQERDQFDAEKRYEYDEEILTRLLSMKAYRDAHTIMSFVSYKSEVDTHDFIKESLRRGKRVAVPVIDWDKRILIASELKSFNELEVGSYGILEPTKEFVRPLDPSFIDFVVVPGAVFDRSGNRIGYGGGYYDKLLPTLKSDALKVGIAYSFQIRENLPVEKHDIKIDMLVTNDLTIKF